MFNGIKFAPLYLWLFLIIMPQVKPTTQPPKSIKHAIILTHGAFSEEDTWFKKGGSFYHEIEKSTRNTIDIFPFSWQQPFYGLLDFEKINAARELACMVLCLKKSGYDHIQIYAHSYGGHVTKIASQLLSENQNDLGIIDAQSISLIKATHPLTTTHDYQIINASFKQAKTDIKALLQEVRSTTNRDTENTDKPIETDKPHEYLIDVVHTLGTPNEEIAFNADMSVIEYMFNGWARGDWVQKFVGSHKLPEPRHERTVNLEYCIAPELQDSNVGWWDTIRDALDYINILPSNFSFFTQGANHIEIRGKIVARWLPFIPFGLMEERLHGFENFSFEHNGILHFSQDKQLPPFYAPAQ